MPVAPIIVVGMHRSGTSLVSRVLSGLGVDMGVDRGHGEMPEFRRVNDRLLREAGGHWARPGRLLCRVANPVFVEEQARRARELLEEAGVHVDERPGPWGWKDPRTTITWPIWLRLFPDARWVVVVRNGLYVALSLHRRERRRNLTNLLRRLGLLRSPRLPAMWPPTIGAGYRLWAMHQHAADALAATVSAAHSVRYEELTAAPEAVVRRLAEFAVDAPVRPDALARSCALVRRPTAPSGYDAMRLRLLLGLIDRRPLAAAGYGASDAGPAPRGASRRIVRPS